MENKIKFIILMTISSFLWFLSILFDKIAMNKIDILAIFCIKAIGILIVIAFVFLFNHRDVLHKKNNDFKCLCSAIMSAILTGVSMILFLKAIL